MQGGKVDSVIQHGIDIVPHSRTEQVGTTVEQPEPERREEQEPTAKQGATEYSLHTKLATNMQKKSTGYSPILLEVTYPIWTPLSEASLIQRRPQH